MDERDPAQDPLFGNDDLDQAVANADATGMVAQQQFVIKTEEEKEL
ncbi:MAG: hypothetical protein M3N19_03410 [Candidatus Eremiobacteraeota bacterium]|nr:hypothetical protein [Candidatus Eremiobacteraeota bacterium]